MADTPKRKKKGFSDYMSQIGANAAGQGRKLLDYAKRGISALDDAAVLGKGKASDIVDEPKKFMDEINKGKKP
jgi:hypothetical protein